MGNFMDSMFGDDKRKQNVQMKTGEITGQLHMFHSLPKEFQTWHTTYYLLEKDGNLNSNSVSKGQLNAYMWKIVMNATNYAMWSFLLILHVIFVERFFDNIFITIIDLGIFLGAALYIAYQFYFFGIIAGQKVGTMTAEMVEQTSYVYYRTYGGVLVALIFMLLFFASFGESIAALLFELIATVELSYTGQTMPLEIEALFSMGIGVHNFIIAALYTEGSTWSDFYTLTFLLTGVLAILIVLIERMGFRTTRRQVLDDIRQDRLNRLFPIERAQQIATEWRRDHGM